MITKMTDLEILIESKDVAKIKEMITAKGRAMVEAVENYEHLTSVKMFEHAENEMSRAQLLDRQITQLKQSLKSIK
jgi:hypothetical protein